MENEVSVEIKNTALKLRDNYNEQKLNLFRQIKIALPYGGSKLCYKEINQEGEKKVWNLFIRYQRFRRC